MYRKMQLSLCLFGNFNNFYIYNKYIICCPQNGSEFFDYQDSIKVCDMGYTDNQAEPLVFKIWFRKRDQKNYVIRANKKEKQQKWVKEIFNLLWKQLEANKSEIIS